ncbi:hypothetical protein NPIL_309231 [Nephila pilipes]|uniref:Uncharacterized protein n=1 Tax=Nephila pilipes TaxID=299642 RepID=A0A8X6TSE7_NEPPI|nr:hypothetical protein NPIL_309231 [Nephila pilipes]
MKTPQIHGSATSNLAMSYWEHRFSAPVAAVTVPLSSARNFSCRKRRLVVRHRSRPAEEEQIRQNSPRRDSKFPA